MKFCCIYEDIIAIAVKSKVILYKISDPASNPQIIEFNKDDAVIIAISANINMAYIFVAYSDKSIYCWDVQHKCIKGSKVLKKRPTALSLAHFTSENLEALILSDKAGDVLGLNVPFLSSQVLLGGHTASVITDLKIVNNSFLVTADRDEKIRVTMFPHTETISSFLLGHTSVITCISSFSTHKNSVTDNFLVSSSWDNQIKLWSVDSGLEIDAIQFSNPSTTSTSITNGDSNMNSSSSNVNNNNLSNMNNNDDDDDDIEKEKVYDESIAGNYPLKIAIWSPQSVDISSSSEYTINDNSVVAYVAVIFRNLNILKTYEIKQNNEDKSIKFCQEEHKYILEGIPVDIDFITSTEVMVFLEKPFYIQTIHLASGTFSKNNIHNNISNVIKHFKDYCLTNNIEYTQQLIYSLDDSESGMRKHELDRRYNSMNNPSNNGTTADVDGVEVKKFPTRWDSRRNKKQKIKKLENATFES